MFCLLMATLLPHAAEVEVTQGHLFYITLETSGDKKLEGHIHIVSGGDMAIAFPVTEKTKCVVDGKEVSLIEMFAALSKAAKYSVPIQVETEKDKSPAVKITAIVNDKKKPKK